MIRLVLNSVIEVLLVFLCDVNGFSMGVVVVDCICYKDFFEWVGCFCILLIEIEKKRECFLYVVSYIVCDFYKI